jgi:hypothetical protein
MRLAAPLAVVACLLLAAADAPKPASKDPQSTVEPRSGPGAGQKLLERFVGDWDVVKTFHPRTGGAPVRAVGRCRQSMIHDGRFLQSDFVFEQGGTKSTGLGLIGFESDTGTFTSVWTDSRRTAMSLRRSRDRFDGTQIVLYSQQLEAADPPKTAPDRPRTTSKTVSRLEDQDRRLIHRQYALGPNGEERLMMELVMTRRPPTP